MKIPASLTGFQYNLMIIWNRLILAHPVYITLTFKIASVPPMQPHVRFRVFLILSSRAANSMDKMNEGSLS